MQVPAGLRSWRSTPAGCPPVSQSFSGSVQLRLRRSGRGSSAAAAHLAPAARRTHPAQAASRMQVRNRKHQCPTCALTVCCTEQHTRRTWTPRLDFAVCNWQAPSDAGEKVHETVEQEMHLLNGYLRKLLVRYIGALLTRLPVALNWEPKPACATQITCPMAFLGILYEGCLCLAHSMLLLRNRLSPAPSASVLGTLQGSRPPQRPSCPCWRAWRAPARP